MSYYNRVGGFKYCVFCPFSFPNRLELTRCDVHIYWRTNIKYIKYPTRLDSTAGRTFPRASVRKTTQPLLGAPGPNTAVHSACRRSSVLGPQTWAAGPCRRCDSSAAPTTAAGICLFPTAPTFGSRRAPTPSTLCKHVLTGLTYAPGESRKTASTPRAPRHS